MSEDEVMQMLAEDGAEMLFEINCDGNTRCRISMLTGGFHDVPPDVADSLTASGRIAVAEVLNDEGMTYRMFEIADGGPKL